MRKGCFTFSLQSPAGSLNSNTSIKVSSSVNQLYVGHISENNSPGMQNGRSHDQGFSLCFKGTGLLRFGRKKRKRNCAGTFVI